MFRLLAVGAGRLARPSRAGIAAAAARGPAAPGGAGREQRRTGVFGAARGGPVEALHSEVTARFKEVARGKPPNISAAQLVQLIFEVGAADPHHMESGEVLNKMMIRGFYGTTTEKRDSYGPPAVPVVGLEESKRWATLLFLDRLKQQERAAAKPTARVEGRAPAPPSPCRSVWCHCPIGPSGTRTCALALQSWERPGAPGHQPAAEG